MTTEPIDCAASDRQLVQCILFLLVPQWAAPVHHGLLTRLHDALSRLEVRDAMDATHDVREACWRLRQLATPGWAGSPMAAAERLVCEA